MTTEETTPRVPRTVAEYWAEQVEKLKDLDMDGIRVVLWDAESAAQDHEHVAAGLLHLPDTGYGLEQLAFALRDVLQQATGDPSVSVTVAELDDDGAGDAQAWARRGVAEHYQDNPYADEDPWHDERDPEDDEDQDDEYEDEEVLNELASLGATLVGSAEDDEDQEPEDDDEPSAEEQAELMRESLEAAEDVRHFPDGTRFLPSYDQDQA